MVAGPGGLHHLRHQLVHRIGHHRLLAHRRQRVLRAPAVVALQAEAQVGFFQRPGQLRLHRAQLHGVGARLEHRQDALQPHLAAQSVDGAAHRGGVVREVVVDLDAAASPRSSRRRRTFSKPASAAPAASGATPTCSAAANGRQRVELVVLAQQRPVDAGDLQAAAQHVEGMRLAARAQAAGFFLARAEALHLAPAAARQHALQRLVARVHHQPARRPARCAPGGGTASRWRPGRGRCRRGRCSRLFRIAVRGR